MGAQGQRPPVEAVVTFLEMRGKPAQIKAPPPLKKVALIRAERPPVHFYRYLYDAVGRPWTWVERKRMTDQELAEIVQDPKVEVIVCWFEGVPAGYYELDKRKADVVDLAYFGLVPEFIGKGLGKWLLATAIDHAWSSGPARITVNTNTLDHPRALPLYQRMGFVPYDRRNVVFDPNV